ncbi:hypothetical protein RRG08_064513 [Elysia crispata]|uniref:Uncharacterized protein n=1 Tax=Elysia crispata TaxID=231223 RepID=A0AAE1DX55_9GAST|nr:hypothetical protein RRG08_064513 [Elysia crispata]
MKVEDIEHPKRNILITTLDPTICLVACPACNELAVQLRGAEGDPVGPDQPSQGSIEHSEISVCRGLQHSAMSAPLRVERSQHSNGCHTLFRMSSDSCGSQCPRLSELRGLSTVTAVTHFSGCPQIHVVLSVRVSQS